MITLAPIAENIQDTLNEKIGMLKKNDGKMEDGSFVPNFEIGGTITDGNRLNENYMFSRTPFLRMTSMSAKIWHNPVVLMGGELSRMGNLAGGFSGRMAAPNGSITEKLETYEKGLYNPHGDMPYRPIPGVSDISVEYRGGGMKLGATRTGEINWKCWSWEDLNSLTPHFLQHGKSVLLEWGWSGPGKLGDVMLFPLFTDDLVPRFGRDALENISDKLLIHIRNQNGHYDAMFGVVQKFDWSVGDDGGFSCNTTVIAPGVTMLQKKHKNFNPNRKLSDLPVLASRSKDAKKPVINGWFGTDAEYKSNIKDYTIAQLAPYITFNEYMRDFPNQIREYIESEYKWVYNRKGPGMEQPTTLHMTENIGGNMVKTPDIGHGRGITKATGKEDGWRGSDHANNWFEARTAIKVSDGGNYPYGEWPNGIGEKIIATGKLKNWKTYELKVQSENKVKDDKGNVVPIGEKKPIFVEENTEVEVFVGKVSDCSNMYVTWGWFEDNVLSRFFGNVVMNQTEVMGEFRSIEPFVNENGKAVLGSTGEDMTRQHVLMQSTRMNNCKYLMTVDASKWLIPNPNDPIVSNSMYYFSLNTDSEPVISTLYETELDIVTKTKASNGERLKDLREEKRFAIAINKATKDYMPIRNILFNVCYLKEKLEDALDLATGVQSVWDEFSSTYGGVYRFKLDYGDNGGTIILREEGYTQHSVKKLLDNKKEKEMGRNPVGPNLFVFPTMEAGSIVKSQNINAKLPDRMQLAAMYGVSSNKTNKDKEEETDFDDVAAIAWGRINSGTGEEQSEFDTLQDLYTGEIDFPSRSNRRFGRTDAIESAKLLIQRVGHNVIPTEPTSDTGLRGMKIYPSILDEVQASQIEELKRREQKYKEDFPDSVDGDGNVKKMEETQQIAEALELAFQEVDNIGSSTLSDWGQLYYNKENVYESGDFPVMKAEAIAILQKFMRGGDDSILGQMDPLIPIEFEIDVDGTGGMFPGNSFHSSYLSERYKEESLFQMKGVGHKVDTNGWTTTIKGLIRAKRLVQKHQTKTSGGKGAGSSAEIGPHGEEVHTNSKGFKYYYDSTNVDPETKKGVLTTWKGNPDIERVNVYPKDGQPDNDYSGDETKDLQPVMYTVGKTYKFDSDGNSRGQIRANKYESAAYQQEQNYIYFGRSDRSESYPFFTFGEHFSLTLERIEEIHGKGKLMNKAVGGSIITEESLKRMNPKLWAIWEAPGEGFRQGEVIIAGYKE